MKHINARRWSGNWFVSADDLNTAFCAGLIDCKPQDRTHGSDYIFSLKDGRQIANIYKDNGFGFCSQAYGVKLPFEFVSSDKVFKLNF